MSNLVTYLFETDYSKLSYYFTIFKGDAFQLAIRFHKDIMEKIIYFFYRMSNFNMESIIINIPITFLTVYQNDFNKKFNTTYCDVPYSDFIFTYLPLYFPIKNNVMVNYYIKQFESLKHVDRISIMLEIDLTTYDAYINGKVKEYNNL